MIKSLIDNWSVSMNNAYEKKMEDKLIESVKSNAVIIEKSGRMSLNIEKLIEDGSLKYAAKQVTDSIERIKNKKAS